MDAGERFPFGSTEEPLPADARRAAIVGGQVSDGLTPAEQRLSQLGAALRAPATPAELVGLAAAQAALASASKVVPFRRGRTAVAVGAGITAIMLLSGVAAAAVGSLPSPIQHWAHSAFGAPDSHPSDSAEPSDSAAPSGPDASGSLTLGTPSAGSNSASAYALCLAWSHRTSDTNPNSAIVRSLTPLAGQQGIAAYCGALLAGPRPTPKASAAASHPARPTGHPTQAQTPTHAASPSGRPTAPPANPHLAPSPAPSHR